MAIRLMPLEFIKYMRTIKDLIAILSLLLLLYNLFFTLFSYDFIKILYINDKTCTDYLQTHSELK
jgi:hypothetical protein